MNRLAFIATAALTLAPSVRATDWPVHAGGNIQTAINSAAVGDTVTIDAGATFTPQILTLPAKSGCGFGVYVTIRTSSFASLPTGRVTLANASLMPTIRRTGPDAGGLFNLAPGTNAGCYYLLGLNLTTDAVNQMVFFLVNFQDVGSAHLVVDRCIVVSAEGETGRTPPYNSSAGLGGILSDGSDVTVENSYVAGWWGLPLGAVAPATMTQSSALGSDSGPCNPCLWTNNYLNGGYSNVQMGGAPQQAVVGATVSSSPAPTTTSATLSAASGLAVSMPIALQVPWSASYCKRPSSFPCWGNGVVQSVVGTTITFTALAGELPDGTRVPTAAPSPGGNAIWAGTQLSGVTITKNWMKFNQPFESWLRFTSGNGNHDKGYMEVKNGNNLDIEANVFGENGGWPSVFGLGNEQNQVGDSPFATQSHVTVKNNWLRGFKQCSLFGDSVTGGYFGFLNTFSDSVLVTNNLCESPDTQAIDNQPALAFAFGIGKTFTFTHNTSLTGWNGVYSAGVMSYDQTPLPVYGAAWAPIVTFKDNLVGWGNYGFGCSAGAIAKCWGAYTESNNLFPLCNASGCTTPDNPVADGIFPHSTAVNNWNSIQFTNPTAHTWSLLPTSPGYHAASDGTDIGVNFPALCAAMSADNPTDGCSSTPPPPPTFTLSFASVNPNVNVLISYSPPDNSANTSCLTPCTTGTFASGVTVTSTAPATSGTHTFGSWSACDTSVTRTCTTLMNANKFPVATYVTPLATLTIASTPSAVPMTYSPADTLGNTSCTTTCAPQFPVGTVVQIVAPATVGVSVFSSWGGCDSVTLRTCTRTMGGSVSVNASYVVPTFTVGVAATNPTTVTASPADNGGHSSVATPGTLVYSGGTTISVTAPSANFVSWSGCPSAATNVCNIAAISSNKSITANYASSPPPTFTLSVGSQRVHTVTIAVSPADSGGHASVATPGSLMYPSATSVTATAPSTVAGKAFSSWSGCDSVVGTACTVAMSANRSITAIYASSSGGHTSPPGRIPVVTEPTPPSGGN